MVIIRLPVNQNQRNKHYFRRPIKIVKNMTRCGKIFGVVLAVFTCTIKTDDKIFVCYFYVLFVVEKYKPSL